MSTRHKFVKRPGSPLFLPVGGDGLPPPRPGTRHLISNGEVIGEVPMSGDDMKDAAAAIALMEAKGHKPATELQQIFTIAVAFSGTARDLYHSHLAATPPNVLAGVPFIVNAAFSIELFLKALHAATTVRSRKRKEHRLLSLYDALPKALRTEIETLATSHAKRHHRGISVPIDFRSLVANLNTAFVRWRYVYEDPGYEKVEFQPAMLVMHVLHDVAALRAHPPGSV